MDGKDMRGKANPSQAHLPPPYAYPYEFPPPAHPQTSVSRQPPPPQGYPYPPVDDDPSRRQPQPPHQHQHQHPYPPPSLHSYNGHGHPHQDPQSHSGFVHPNVMVYPPQQQQSSAVPSQEEVKPKISPGLGPFSASGMHSNSWGPTQSKSNSPITPVFPSPHGGDPGMSATATATSSPFRQLPSPLSDDHHQHQHHYRPSDKEESRESKRAKRSGRQSSEAEEVEAGLALAGMGMPVSEHDGQEGARKDKVMAEKKTKKEKEKEVKKEKGDDKDKDEKTVKPEGQGKKSCSECRRLKAKCDRVFPCSNCRRRGCAAVCPDGDLSCMQGKRLVLASTEQLHERIAQLESALAQAHAKVTGAGGNTGTHIHPLLGPAYLDGGFANVKSTPPVSTTDSAFPSPANPGGAASGRNTPATATGSDRITPMTSLGTSNQLERQSSQGQGRMAVESLLLSDDAAAREGKREDEWVGENAAPAMIVGEAVPPEEEGKDQVIERLKKILRILPPREVVHQRAEHWFRTQNWISRIMLEPEFMDVYEPAVYSPTPQNPLSPHKLACVLIILTLDTYLDVTGDENDPSVAVYWQGVQQCFDTRFGWAASVAGVQALGLATYFVGFGWRGARASNFYWLRQCSSAILQLGLHKDPHPSLPETERNFRRRVFWEAYTMDNLLSINHGQRPGVELMNVETIYPTDASNLQAIKYDYITGVKVHVLDVGCRPDSAPASWERVKSIHEAMMKWDAVAQPHIHCEVLSGGPMPSIANDQTNPDFSILERHANSMCHYKAMLYLFRPSLRRLIGRLRNQPFDSITLDEADRLTITMTYKACSAITAVSRYMTRTHPRLTARLWSTWVQTFSAAVSMAALAIWCAPHLEPNFVHAAYKELSQACDMIRENRSDRSKGVENLLPVLQSLVSGRYPQVLGGDATSARVQPQGEDMLYALLGGQVGTKAASPIDTRRMILPAVNASQGEASTSGKSTPQSQVATQAQPSLQTSSHLLPRAQAPTSSQTQLTTQGPGATQISTALVPSQLLASGNIDPAIWRPPPPPQMSNQRDGHLAPANMPFPQAQLMQNQNQSQLQYTDTNNNPLAVPIVTPIPSAFALDSTPFPLHQAFYPGQAQGQTHINYNPNPPPMTDITGQYSLSTEELGGEKGGNGDASAGLDGVGFDLFTDQMASGDLWARLQTFYEPTPVYWGQSVVPYVGDGMGGFAG